MSDADNRDELERLAGMSDETLFEEPGKSLERSAAECLNKALLKHGGKELVFDDIYNMDYYIELDKLNDVLNDARRLAEERGTTIPQTIDINSVVTDSDALEYVMGG